MKNLHIVTDILFDQDVASHTRKFVFQKTIEIMIKIWLYAKENICDLGIQSIVILVTTLAET